MQRPLGNHASGERKGSGGGVEQLCAAHHTVHTLTPTHKHCAVTQQRRGVVDPPGRQVAGRTKRAGRRIVHANQN